MSGDRITKALLFISSLTILLLGAGIVISLFGGAIPAFREFGLKFIVSPAWNPTTAESTALSFIANVITSILPDHLSQAFSTSLLSPVL
jgi:phosphate transport system permease protein